MYLVARPLSRPASSTSGEAAALFCAAWDDKTKAAAFAAGVSDLAIAYNRLWCCSCGDWMCRGCGADAPP